MSDSTCGNCRYSRSEPLLPGTGAGNERFYWVCLVFGKPRNVFEHGYCQAWQARKNNNGGLI